jgi:hypothetical protein
MNLLAIDVSTSKESKNGWAIWLGNRFEFGTFPYNSPSEYVTYVVELIKKYSPQCVFYADSHGRYNVIRAHARLHAYIDLAADEMGIQSQAISEPHARLVVLGNGKASTEETMELMGVDNQDIADAMLLIECYLKDLQNDSVR